MAKNRTIPFGYMMKNGKITTNPKEVLAVLTIFNEYLSGKSLKEIAEMMEVPYSTDAQWNKNMVKRIIENEKYLGTKKYPQLISEDIFISANEKRKKKSTSLCEVPPELKCIRDITYCKECSHKMFRGTDGYWNCRNKKCFRLEYQLSDNMLTSTIAAILNAVHTNPSLIEQDCEIGRYIPNSEIMVRQSEINRMIDSPTADFDEIKAELIHLAEMKYERCTYSDTTQKTELLRLMIANYEPSKCYDTIDMLQ